MLRCTEEEARDVDHVFYDRHWYRLLLWARGDGRRIL